MSAQQDRLDREMLRSMAASFSSGLGFSFNRQDMADLMMRMSERVDPRPRRADLAPAAPKVKALVEAAKEAVEALDYSVSEIADLENTLSNYRQNWQPAAAALSVLRAALAALEGGDA